MNRVNDIKMKIAENLFDVETVFSYLHEELWGIETENDHGKAVLRIETALANMEQFLRDVSQLSMNLTEFVSDSPESEVPDA